MSYKKKAAAGATSKGVDQSKLQGEEAPPSAPFGEEVKVKLPRSPAPFGETIGKEKMFHSFYGKLQKRISSPSECQQTEEDEEEDGKWETVKDE